VHDARTARPDEEHAKLDDLEKRLRCSTCGKKSCHVRAIEMQKPRGTPPAHQGASRFTFEIASVIEPNPASLNIIDWWA